MDYSQTSGVRKIVIPTEPVGFLELTMATAYYLLQQIFFIKDLVESILFVRKLLRTCVVGYSSPYFVFFRRDNVPIERDEVFAPFGKIFLMSPRVLVDCETANKVVERCREVAGDEASRWDKSDPEMAALLLYLAKILHVWKLFDVVTVIRWLGIRRRIKKFELNGIEFHRIATDNWLKLESQIRTSVG